MDQRRGLASILIALLVGGCICVVAAGIFYRVIQQNEEELQQELLWDFCQQNGAYVESRLTGYVSTCKAWRIVCALGPWTLATRRMSRCFRA